MAEKAIERYRFVVQSIRTGNIGIGVLMPDPSGEWMRYDAELVRDALRYRWLKRAMGDGNTPYSETAYTTVTCLPSEKWDAAIDTAIAQADGGEG